MRADRIERRHGQDVPVRRRAIMQRGQGHERDGLR